MVTNFKTGDKVLLGDGISANLTYDHTGKVAYLDLSANGVTQQVVLTGAGLDSSSACGGGTIVGGGLTAAGAVDAALHASISSSLEMAAALDQQVAMYS